MSVSVGVRSGLDRTHDCRPAGGQHENQLASSALLRDQGGRSPEPPTELAVVALKDVDC